MSPILNNLKQSASRFDISTELRSRTDWCDCSCSIYSTKTKKMPVYLNACIYVLTRVKGKTVSDEGSKKPSIADPPFLKAID